MANDLKAAVRALLEYVDALPSEVAVALPGMPGVDRDWVESVLAIEPRCKQCQHWTAHAISPSDGWGNCALGETGWSLPTVATTTARAQDCEGMHAWLETHETFGCVQWEQEQANA